MKKLNFNYYGKKHVFFSVSLVLFAVIAAVAIFAGVLLDIQFKGGTIMTYNYAEGVDIGDLEKTIEGVLGEQVVTQTKKGLDGASSVDITLAKSEGINADLQSELSKKLEEKYGDKLELVSNSSVNPTIGKEFFEKSMLAIAFSALVLIIYIAIRFKKIGGWSAGVTAVAALIHDVIIVFGTFVVFRIPLDYNFVAVVLTILGYSINDTIVIYDRIRENKRLYGTSTPLPQLVNNSINETMARTINTTLSTLISMVVVSIVAVAFNVSSILSFSFPMIIGMISGTYSTVFIAGPLWVMWQERKSKKAHHGHKKA